MRIPQPLCCVTLLTLLATGAAVVAEPPQVAKRATTYEIIHPQRNARGIWIEKAQDWIKQAGVSLDDGTSRTLIVGRFSRPPYYPNLSTTTDENKILSLDEYRAFQWPYYSDDGPELNVLVVEQGTTSTSILFVPAISESELDPGLGPVADNIIANSPRNSEFPAPKGERVINYEIIDPYSMPRNDSISFAHFWLREAGVSLDDESARTLIVGVDAMPWSAPLVAKTSKEAEILTLGQYRDFRWPVSEVDDAPTLSVLVIDRGTTETTVLFIVGIGESELWAKTGPVAANIVARNPRNLAFPAPKSERVINYEFITPNPSPHGVMESVAHYWMREAAVSLDDQTSRTLIVGITSRPRIIPHVATSTDGAEILPLDEYRKFRWPVPEADDVPVLSVLVIERGTTETTVLFVDYIDESDLEADSSPVAANINSHNPSNLARPTPTP